MKAASQVRSCSFSANYVMCLCLYDNRIDLRPPSAMRFNDLGSMDRFIQ